MLLEINPERRLLSCILLKPEILSTVRGFVMASDFVDEDYQVLYQATCHLDVDEITIHTLISKLPDFPTRKRSLADLAHAIHEEHPNASGWRHWTYKVVEASEHRRLQQFARETSFGDDLADALKRLESLVRKIRGRLALAQKGLKCHEKSGQSGAGTQGT